MESDDGFKILETRNRNLLISVWGSRSRGKAFSINPSGLCPSGLIEKVSLGVNFPIIGSYSQS